MIVVPKIYNGGSSLSTTIGYFTWPTTSQSLKFIALTIPEIFGDIPVYKTLASAIAEMIGDPSLSCNCDYAPLGMIL